MRDSRREFCEQIVSKFKRRRLPIARKPMIYKSLFGCGGWI